MAKDWVDLARLADGDFLSAPWINAALGNLETLERGESQRIATGFLDEQSLAARSWQPLQFPAGPVVIEKEGIYLLWGHAQITFQGEATDREFLLSLTVSNQARGEPLPLAGAGGFGPADFGHSAAACIPTLWHCYPGDVIGISAYTTVEGAEVFWLANAGTTLVAQPPRHGDPDFSDSMTWTNTPHGAEDFNRELIDNPAYLRNRLCARFQSQGTQSIPPSTAVAVGLPQKVFGPESMRDPSNPSRMVIPAPGLWLFGGGVGWAPSFSGHRLLRSRSNGSTFHSALGWLRHHRSGQRPMRFTTFSLDAFAEGDYLELVVDQTASGSVSLAHDWPLASHLWALRMGEL